MAARRLEADKLYHSCCVVSVDLRGIYLHAKAIFYKFSDRVALAFCAAC